MWRQAYQCVPLTYFPCVAHFQSSGHHCLWSNVSRRCYQQRQRWEPSSMTCEQQAAQLEWRRQRRCRAERPPYHCCKALVSIERRMQRNSAHCATRPTDNTRSDHSDTAHTLSARDNISVPSTDSNHRKHLTSASHRFVWPPAVVHVIEPASIVAMLDVTEAIRSAIEAGGHRTRASMAGWACVPVRATSMPPPCVTCRAVATTFYGRPYHFDGASSAGDGVSLDGVCYSGRLKRSGKCGVGPRSSGHLPPLPCERPFTSSSC